MYAEILYEVDGPLLTLTINRPKILNALNDQVLDELYAALRHAVLAKYGQTLDLAAIG